MSTSTATYEISITERLEISDNTVSEVLETPVGSGASLHCTISSTLPVGSGLSIESTEVHESHTREVEVKTGGWARSTGGSIEINTACSNGSTDADSATTR